MLEDWHFLSPKNFWKREANKFVGYIWRVFSFKDFLEISEKFFHDFSSKICENSWFFLVIPRKIPEISSDELLQKKIFRRISGEFLGKKSKQNIWTYWHQSNPWKKKLFDKFPKEFLKMEGRLEKFSEEFLETLFNKILKSFWKKHPHRNSWKKTKAEIFFEEFREDFLDRTPCGI